MIAGDGEGRREIQLNNQYDACCFYGIPHQTYTARVKKAVELAGAGKWEFYLDSTHRAHQISPHAIFDVIDPALGLKPIPAPPPKIDETFNDASTPPRGWRYDPTNGGAPTISAADGQARFSGGKGIVSILHDSVFKPQGRLTATLKIERVGPDGFLGVFLTSNPEFRDRQIGLQVSASGQLLLNADHGAGWNSREDQFELTRLEGYQGGPITLTLTLDADGLTAATDVGNFSKQIAFPLANGFSLRDLGPEAYLFVQNYNGKAGDAVVESVRLEASAADAASATAKK